MISSKTKITTLIKGHDFQMGLLPGVITISKSQLDIAEIKREVPGNPLRPGNAITNFTALFLLCIC